MHMTDSTRRRALVSIIVLNYNGKHLLDDCIGSIQEQDYHAFEIIVADNCSEDDSVAYIRERFPEVQVVEHPCNYGFSLGNNIAARQAKGRYFFFLNNDTRLDPHCLSALVDSVESNNADICGCTVTDFEGANHPLVMGCDFMGFPFQGRFFYVEGCALFIKRDSYYELDGFDEDYFMFYEDLDICWRARLAGKTISYVEEAVVRHKGGATLSGGRPEHRGYTTNCQRRYLGERNNMRTLLKNYKLQTLLVVLPVYLFVNILEIITLLIIGRNPKATCCYFKAYASNIVSLPKIMRTRRRVQASRKVGDLEIIRRMSFVPLKLKMLLKVGIPIIE